MSRTRGRSITLPNHDHAVAAVRLKCNKRSLPETDASVAFCGRELIQAEYSVIPASFPQQSEPAGNPALASIRSSGVRKQHTS